LAKELVVAVIQLLQLNFSKNMNIIVGEQAEKLLDKYQGTIPSQDVTGTALVTGAFFARAARCTIVRPGSLDQVASWSDSVAKLRYVQLGAGEAVQLQPNGTCAIFSFFPIQKTTSTNSLPQWLNNGQVAIDLADSGGLASSAADQQALAADTNNGGVLNPNLDSYPNGAVLPLSAYFDRLPFTGMEYVQPD
jgi:hypothetical protein